MAGHPGFAVASIRLRLDRSIPSCDVRLGPFTVLGEVESEESDNTPPDGGDPGTVAVEEPGAASHPAAAVCSSTHFGTRAARDRFIPPAAALAARPPPDPEQSRNAEKRLEEQMTESYSETIHQTGFCGRLDLMETRAGSASFRAIHDESVATIVRASV